MNTCDHGHQTNDEVRLLPFPNGNLIVCRFHYGLETKARKVYEDEPFPAWESLKIYSGE